MHHGEIYGQRYHVRKTDVFVIKEHCPQAGRQDYLNWSAPSLSAPTPRPLAPESSLAVLESVCLNAGGIEEQVMLMGLQMEEGARC